MFKKFLKDRHDRKAGNVLRGPPAPRPPAPGPPAPGPANQQPGYGATSARVYSQVPVEYAASPPGTAPQEESPAMFTCPAVEYPQSPPSVEASRMYSRGPAVEYYQSFPTEIPEHQQQRRYYPPVQQVRLGVPAEMPAHQSPAELSGNSPLIRPSHRPLEVVVMKTPQELPATPLPPRYEMPVAITPCPYLALTSTNPSAGSRNSWTNSSRYTTPATSPPPAPRRNSSMHPSIPVDSTMTNQRITKCTVNIFCQRKTEGPRQELLPRDIREFRLAKVALIPVLAGSRRFVSLDVVFGEVDKTLAPYLEKHFLITPSTSLTKVTAYKIAGAEDIWVIENLTVAYDGIPSLLYITFRSPQEETKFKADFESVRKFAECST